MEKLKLYGWVKSADLAGDSSVAQKGVEGFSSGPLCLQLFPSSNSLEVISPIEAIIHRGRILPSDWSAFSLALPSLENWLWLRIAYIITITTFFSFFLFCHSAKKKEKNVLKSIILKEKNGRPDAVEKHGVDGIDWFGVFAIFVTKFYNIDGEKKL